MKSKFQYQVRWKRKGDLRWRTSVRGTEKGAMSLVNALNGQPWKSYGRIAGPDDYWCCGGDECTCGGITMREFYDEQVKKKYPDGLLPIVAIEIRVREVYPWMQYKATGLIF